MASNTRSTKRRSYPSLLDNGKDYVLSSKNRGLASSNHERIRDRSEMNLSHKSKRNIKSCIVPIALLMTMILAFYANASVFLAARNDYNDQEISHDKTRNNADALDSHTPRTATLRGSSTKSDFPREEVMRMLKHMYDGDFINKAYFEFVLKKSKELLHTYETVYDIPFPQGSDESADPMVTIVGDIHGQYLTVLHIFQANGFPSTNHVYIFNGDFIDRGPHTIQTITTLLLFKLHCPKCIHFTRGNHETKTFLGGQVEREVVGQYDKEVHGMMVDVVNELPLAVILEQKLLVIHAGINSPNLTIDEMKEIPRGMDSSENDLFEDLLWADPMPQNGVEVDETRGTTFGPDVSKSFLNRNHLDLIIRGHTTVENGYASHHDGRVVTIFSAPEYGMGSYANINSDLKLSVKHFEAYPTISEIQDWSIL